MRVCRRFAEFVLAVMFIAAVFIGIGSEGFRNWEMKTWFNYWGAGEQQAELPAEGEQSKDPALSDEDEQDKDAGEENQPGASDENDPTKDDDEDQDEQSKNEGEQKQPGTSGEDQDGEKGAEEGEDLLGKEAIAGLIKAIKQIEEDSKK